VGKKTAKQRLTREFSAGGVVYKGKGWLIIKPAGTDRWQFPKGQIDEGESPGQAALREVMEEGGIEARLVSKIGKTQYFFHLKGKRIFKTVVFFLMEYIKDTKEGPDSEVAKVCFLPFKKAYKKLSFKNDKEILVKAREILDRGIQ
jgi:8-oxo-dGTP pyrophosphatase MutT (NUDIX family)